MPSNYGRGGGAKKSDGKIADKFRDACPPHKIKDLDNLVKQCKGDETKIQAKITEWWDEPQVEEPQWESVGKANKKAPEKKTYGGDRGGDRDRDRGGDRGERRNDRDRGGVSGGRRGDRSSYGGGRDGPRRDGRGGRGGGARYGDRDRNRVGGDRGSQQRAPAPAPASASAPAPAPKRDGGIPTPVTNVPVPKGAWGQGAQSFAAAAASKQPPPAPATASVPPPAAQAPSPVSEPNQLPLEETLPVIEPEEEGPVDLGGPAVNMISAEDPTPSGLPSSAAPLAPTPIAVTGNVWGSKGGAHLILAERHPISVAPAAAIAPEQELFEEFEEPEPAEPEVVLEEPEPMPMPMPVEEEPMHMEPEPEPETPVEPDSSFGVSTLDSVLPPSVNGANINASGWEPILDQPAESSQHQPPQQQQSVDVISHPSPVGALSVGTAPSMPEPEPMALPEPMSLPEPIASTPPAVQVAVAPVAATTSGVKPSSVLNMGHWETGDGDDEALDFGFGSFAPENDVEVTTATDAVSSSSANVSSAAPSTSQVPPPPPSTTESTHLPSATTAPATLAHGASPARPPPGLSMPPMPANAMLVHELENKLENTTLGGPKVVDTSPAVVSEKTTTTSASTQSSSSQPQSFNAVNELAGQMVNPPGMSQYGGMGMYNIHAPPGVPNGLGGMPPGQFPLGGATNQQPPQPSAQQNDARSQLNQGTQQQQQQQQVPYGMQPTPSTTAATTNSAAAAPSNDTAGGAPGAPGNNNNANAGGGMPPGMPSMQYPNPAYMYAGQFSQMGHPAYGMQYGHAGYGQQPFAPPQGGHQFGYANQGLMAGQGVSGGGYGAPAHQTHQSHYEEQARGGPGGGPRGGGGGGGGNMRDNHQGGGGGGGAGGYQKGGRGGYRSNRNHHQNNHSSGGGYGNNYQANPNLGAYGVSGPYNMGYGHGVSGYGNPVNGPSGMDPYGMQAQQQQQQQQQQSGYGGVGGGGFSHQESDHKKSSGGGPHHHSGHGSAAAGSHGHHQQAAGGFQQQSHLHQQPLGLQGTSTADSGTGVAGGGASGGWPGSRQQHWGGNWQQEN
mmetsp:Transcript_34823/g.64412  ORF Transcript_34823/g.64412 Transcript_34823/m.64412 type:complete len:1063 (+) Transcript_34823:119-3307(+)